jgi:hypothetical protein
MQRRSVLGLAALAGAALAPRAFAHHGWSSFDQDRPIWLEGKVIKVAWRNPHAELEIELLHQKIDLLREKEVGELIRIIRRLEEALPPPATT